jgi:hypothetical protein
LGISIIEDGLHFFDGQQLVFPKNGEGSVRPDTDEDRIAGPGLWCCFRQNLEQAGFEADDVIVAYLSVIVQTEHIIESDRADSDVGVIGVSGRTAERAVPMGPVGSEQEGIGLFEGGNCGEA